MQIQFEDIAVYFSKEEWESLEEPCHILYKEVMVENYQNVLSLGSLCLKPELISLIEHGLEPYMVVENKEIHADLLRGYEKKIKNEPEQLRIPEQLSTTVHAKSIIRHKRPSEAESVAMSKRQKKQAPALHIEVIKEEPEEIWRPAHKENNDRHHRLFKEYNITVSERQSVLEVGLHEEITCGYNPIVWTFPHQDKCYLQSSNTACLPHVKQLCDQVSEQSTLMFNGMDSSCAPIVKDEPEDFSITLHTNNNDLHRIPLQTGNVTLSESQGRKEPSLHVKLSDDTTCVYKQRTLSLPKQSDCYVHGNSLLCLTHKDQQYDLISEQSVMMCTRNDPVCVPIIKDEPEEFQISGNFSNANHKDNSSLYRKSFEGTILLLNKEPSLGMERKEETTDVSNTHSAAMWYMLDSAIFCATNSSQEHFSKTLQTSSSGESTFKNSSKPSHQKRRYSQNINYKCAKQPRTLVAKARRKEIKTKKLKHMQSLTHTHKKYACAKCGKCYRFKYHLLLHRKLHVKNNQKCRPIGLGRVFSCETYKKIFQSRYSLKSCTNVHPADHTKTRGDCEKMSNNSSTIVKRRRTHTKEKTYGCTKCESIFANKASLASHMRIHTVKNYPCAVCGKSFDKKFSFNSHMRTHTGEKPYPCPECGKCFARKSQVRLHLKIHTGLKPFTCSECGRSFALKHNLKAHEKIHTGEKPFFCSECGKEFVRKSQLGRHLRTHTGEKPYFCSYCGKSFALKCTLDTHVKWHTRENLYKCNICKKGYSTNSQLDRHAAVHEKPKVYRCSTCGKKGGKDCILILRKVFQDEVERHVCTVCDQLYFIPFENAMGMNSTNSV